MSSVEFHLDKVKRCCRICARFVHKERVTYNCNESETLTRLTRFYGVESSEPSESTPSRICNSCHIRMTKWEKSNKREDSKKATPYDWSIHQSNDCKVCTDFLERVKGNRRPGRSTNHGRGRPATPLQKNSPHAIPAHILPNVSAPTIPPLERFFNPRNEIVCPICLDILQSPVQGQCEHVYCACCIRRWLFSLPNAQCPVCKVPMHFQELEAVPRLLMTLILEAPVKCRVCGKPEPLEGLERHENVCNSKENTGLLANLGQDAHTILQSPDTKPLNMVEEKIATNLLKRKIATTRQQPGKCKCVKIITNGTPLYMTVIPSPRISSSEASDRTLRRRSSNIEEMRSIVSGGSVKDVETQYANEFKRLGQEQRKEIIKEAGLKIDVPPGEGLAMKATLGIPWNKLRHLRSWGVKIQSEGKLRTEGQKLELCTLQAEQVPFSFKIKNGTEIRFAPCVRVESLRDFTFNYLDQCLECNMLTWHGELIPEDEVWLKIGGDKGGGSFKMSFQIANLECPNSVRNTAVFCIFDAPDTYHNVSTALKKYQDEITLLQNSQWRGKKMFVFGDYALLCILYGISGASGRYFCLWCLLTQAELASSPPQANDSPERTLQELREDHTSFLANGGSISKAKQYHNVIHPALLDVPLDQVCIPGLHVSLGIFQRIYTLLVHALEQLDLKLAIEMAQDGQMLNVHVGSKEFNEYVAALHDAQSKELQAAHYEEMANANDELANYLLLHCDDLEVQNNITTLRSKSKELHEQANVLDDDAKTIRGANKLNSEDGPASKELKRSLQSIGVQQQAYHGGGFVGNHVHKCCEAINVKKISSVATTVTEKLCPALLTKAESVQTKFELLLGGFAKCHRVYDCKKQLSNEVISQLDKDIKSFMVIYRTQFPNASVLPKMHFLEKHIITWVRQWKCGLGYHGEQGAGSIHNVFNQLDRQHACVADKTEKLRCMCKEHHRQIHPQILAKVPEVKKRK